MGLVKNGCYSKLPCDDNAHYYQADRSRYFPDFSEVDPEKLYYVEPWDISDISYPYDWSYDGGPRPIEDFIPPYLHDTLKAVVDKVAHEVSVHSEIFSPFSQFLELLNYEMALLDDPGKCQACLESLTCGAVDLGCRQVKCGADDILVSSPFAENGFLSSESYMAFVLPYEKKVVEEIKKQCDNIHLYVHTCGWIGDRLDLMMQSDFDRIDTLDPPPLGTVELKEAVEQTKGHVFIKGNIDPVHTLLLGDKEMVKDAVDNRLSIAKSGGGYILSTACSVGPPTKPELLQYMVERVHEMGCYDVD
jgi:uroporphyrinogen decarboxylase